MFPPLQIFLVPAMFSLPTFGIRLNAMNFRHEELVGNFCLLLASEVDNYSDAPVCVDADIEDSPCLYSELQLMSLNQSSHPDFSSLCNNGCHSTFNLVIYIQCCQTVLFIPFL